MNIVCIVQTSSPNSLQRFKNQKPRGSKKHSNVFLAQVLFCCFDSALISPSFSCLVFWCCACSQNTFQRSSGNVPKFVCSYAGDTLVVEAEKKTDGKHLHLLVQFSVCATPDWKKKTKQENWNTQTSGRAEKQTSRSWGHIKRQFLPRCWQVQAGGGFDHFSKMIKTHPTNHLLVVLILNPRISRYGEVGCLQLGEGRRANICAICS